VKQQANFSLQLWDHSPILSAIAKGHAYVSVFIWQQEVIALSH
jgi:hypothetical protein